MTAGEDIYVIGSKSEFDDLSEFWANVLDSDNQRSRLVVTDRDVATQMAVNASKGKIIMEPSERGKVAKIFVDSLSHGNGRISRANLKDVTNGDPANVIAVLQVMERKVVELRSTRVIWMQFTACSLAWLWTHANSLLHFCAFALLLTVFVGSSLRPLIQTRTFMYDYFFTFFNTRIIASTNAALFLFGPVVTVMLVNDRGAPPYILLAPLSSLIVGLVSNFANEYRFIRRVCKLHVLSSLILQLCILTSSGIYATWFEFLFVSLVLNWSTGQALLGLILGTVVLVLAFLRDVFFGMRNTIFWRIVAFPVLCCCVWLRVAHGLDNKLTYALAALAIGVLIPTPPLLILQGLEFFAALFLDIAAAAIVFGQTVLVTFVVFNASPRLGFKWLRYCVSPARQKFH